MISRNIGKLGDEVATPSDVAYYIRKTLRQTGLRLGERQIGLVIEAAGNSLVWAVSACRYLRFIQILHGPQDEAHDRMVQWVCKNVFQPKPDLSTLYGAILTTLHGYISFDEIRSAIKASMGITLPVRLSALREIASSHFRSSTLAVYLPMISDCQDDPMISAPHPSFLAFLRDREQSGRYYADENWNPLRQMDADDEERWWPFQYNTWGKGFVDAMPEYEWRPIEMQ